MKLFSMLWATVMILFGVLQFNDPDPLAWSAVYFMTAALWIGGAFGRNIWWLELIVLVLLIFWMGSLGSGVVDLVNEGELGDLFATMTPDKPYIELAREFLGLAIAAVSVGWLLIRSILDSRSTEGDKS